MKALLFILILLPLGTYAQAQADTSGNYSIARYKVDRLIKIALKAKECDSLVTAQEKLINDDIRAQAKADSIMKAMRIQINTFKEDVHQRDSLDRDRVKQIASANNKSKKWKVIAILSLAEILKILFGGGHL